MFTFFNISSASVQFYFFCAPNENMNKFIFAFVRLCTTHTYTLAHSVGTEIIQQYTRAYYNWDFSLAMGFFRTHSKFVSIEWTSMDFFFTEWVFFIKHSWFIFSTIECWPRGPSSFDPWNCSVFEQLKKDQLIVFCHYYHLETRVTPPEKFMHSFTHSYKFIRGGSP